MNINGLPRPDFSNFAAPRQNPHEKRGRATPPPIEIRPQDQALEESPTKRLREQEKNSFDDLSGVMGGVFLSPTKKEASQLKQISLLTNQIGRVVNLAEYIRHAVADAIIFAFSAKVVDGTYFEPKDNIVPLSIIYDFDARTAYVDLEQPVRNQMYPHSRLALQVTVPKNKAEETIVKKFQLVPCTEMPYEKRTLETNKHAKGSYVPCEAYFLPHKKCAIPTRYAMFPLFERRLEAFRGQPELQKDLVKITHSALKALSTLHAAGIIHGKICLENIHVDENGCAKLTNFSRADSIKAILWQMYGNIKHTAPEFFADEQPENQHKFAQDVYAFGCSMRQVITKDPLPWEQKMQDLQRLYEKYNATEYTADENTNDIVKLLGEIGKVKQEILQQQQVADKDADAAKQILATSKPTSLSDYAIVKLISQTAMHSDVSKRISAQDLANTIVKFIASDPGTTSSAKSPAAKVLRFVQ